MSVKVSDGYIAIGCYASARRTPSALRAEMKDVERITFGVLRRRFVIALRGIELIGGARLDRGRRLMSCAL